MRIEDENEYINGVYCEKETSKAFYSEFQSSLRAKATVIVSKQPHSLPYPRLNTILADY